MKSTSGISFSNAAVAATPKHLLQFAVDQRVPLEKRWGGWYVTGKSGAQTHLGNFVVREKNSRIGRNPQTGQEITISARRVLTFRPIPAIMR